LTDAPAIGAPVDWAALEAAARAVRDNAHAPYSGYRVGSALLTRTGRVFAGCNVENASYGLSICAERSAVTQMVAAGAAEPVAVLVLTSGPEAAAPCGACRQTLVEVAGDDLPVRLMSVDQPGRHRDITLGELLPLAFRAAALRR
jgi:cytidine deaminase